MGMDSFDRYNKTKIGTRTERRRLHDSSDIASFLPISLPRAPIKKPSATIFEALSLRSSAGADGEEHHTSTVHCLSAAEHPGGESRSLEVWKVVRGEKPHQ